MKTIIRFPHKFICHTKMEFKTNRICSIQVNCDKRKIIVYRLSGQELLGIDMATVHQVAAINRPKKRSYKLFISLRNETACVEIDG